MSVWIAFTTLPNSELARARTEAKPPSFIRTLFLSQDPFPTLQFLDSEIQLSLPFSPSPLFLPDYMSSYRKTMPSLTLVLTSGHPSSNQPTSAMLPTAPDFLMVHIWPSLSHSCWFYNSFIARKPLIYATILRMLNSMRDVTRMRPFSKWSKRVLTRSKYVCFFKLSTSYVETHYQRKFLFFVRKFVSYKQKFVTGKTDRLSSPN